jgi:hypothetical protein
LREAWLRAIQPDLGVGTLEGQIPEPGGSDELVAEIGIARRADQINETRLHGENYIALGNLDLSATPVAERMAAVEVMPHQRRIKGSAVKTRG